MFKKMIKKEKKEETSQKKEHLKVVEEFYFFPDKGKTIKATSLEEALEKLNANKIR